MVDAILNPLKPVGHYMWQEVERLFLLPYVAILFCYVRIAVLRTLVAGLRPGSQYPEGPATDHLDRRFFLVSLYLKANAEMIPKIPSSYCMLLM
jgi:hypothetical protein